MKELEEYARINNIPIMQKDGILYLINYIKENNIKNILEIGSAIGYSSIMMASIDKNIKVTTIERDKDRYDLAVTNIKKYNLDNQINIIYGDAADTDITYSNCSVVVWQKVTYFVKSFCLGSSEKSRHLFLDWFKKLFVR